ncbi:MAG: hypothetical protein KBC17_02345 [Candidatus Pacebacteria bacterium]|nr:hypothetical protein [Candidatus Paceibacterota bacterium]
MKKVSDLLARFSELSKKSDTTKDLIISLIKEAGINFIDKKTQIVIKGDNIFLKISPIKKNEVFLKKEKIISLLKSNKATSHLSNIL